MRSKSPPASTHVIATREVRGCDASPWLTGLGEIVIPTEVQEAAKPRDLQRAIQYLQGVWIGVKAERNR